MALWSMKMTRAIWLPQSKLWEFTVSWKKVAKVYICASYIVFLFVKMENNNFIKEIKHVVRAFIACWKPPQSLWEFSSRWKPSTASRVFGALLSNCSKHSLRFSPESMENMFYFLNEAFYLHLVNVPLLFFFYFSVHFLSSINDLQYCGNLLKVFLFE